MTVWFSLKSILIRHLNHSNRVKNEQVMAKIRMLVEREKQSTTCTGTALICTGIGLVLEVIPHLFRTCTGTGSVLEGCFTPVPVQVSEICQEIVYFTIFHALFFHNSLLIHPSSKTNMESLPTTPQTLLICKRILGFIPKFTQFYKTLEL